MTNFSRLLEENMDAIVQTWIAAMRQDQQIATADQLSATAIKDHLPDVLKVMVTVLKQPQNSDIRSLVDLGLQHGELRAAQGFNPTEIAREYHLLHSVIFSTLEPALLQGSAAEAIWVFRVVDALIHEAIAQCFKSYTAERLQELEQLQSQLMLTNQELSRLIHAHQDNLAYLAHELKTPLSAMMGYSETFLRSYRQKADPKTGVNDTLPNLEYIERVLRGGRRLLHLINDALEFSRSEAGTIELHLAPTDMRSLLDQVMQMLEPLVAQKQLELKLDDEQAPAEVLTDPLRLQQIVINLVSNAIRYTDEGAIEIKCSSLSDNQWALSVSDTGIGIAPEDQTRIFEPFFRAASQHFHPDRGTGLGLALVARLVELLHGKIELVSAIGAGTTFTLVFPLKPELLPARSP